MHYNITDIKCALWLVNWPFYYYFAYGWMVKRASTHSKPYSPLSIQLPVIFFISRIAQNDFSLNTKRKFTKTVNDNVKLRQRTRHSAKRFFWKKRICQEWCAWRKQIKALTSFPCHLWAKLKAILFWLCYEINW